MGKSRGNLIPFWRGALGRKKRPDGRSKGTLKARRTVPISRHFSACSFCRFHFESTTRTQGLTDSRQQHQNMGYQAHHNSTRVFGMPPTTRILNLEIKARAAIPLPRKDSLNLVLAQWPVEKRHQMVCTTSPIGGASRGLCEPKEAYTAPGASRGYQT